MKSVVSRMISQHKDLGLPIKMFQKLDQKTGMKLKEKMLKHAFTTQIKQELNKYSYIGDEEDLVEMMVKRCANIADRVRRIPGAESGQSLKSQRQPTNAGRDGESSTKKGQGENTQQTETTERN